MKAVLIAVLSLFLAGCINEKAMLQKFASKEDDEFARRFLDLIRQARYEEADTMLVPAVAAEAGATGLSQLHKIIDHGEPVSVELIGANVVVFQPWGGAPAKRKSDLTYQLQFKDAWVVAGFIIENSDQGRRIAGVNFQPVSNSLQVLNHFDFRNKSTLHYVFFLLCILTPIFNIFTAVVCVRSRVRRRWVWMIFVLLGVCRFNLNWTTGAWNLQPISVMLLGSAWFRASSYAPVIASFGIPIGAIIFWLRRKRLSPTSDEPTITEPLSG